MTVLLVTSFEPAEATAWQTALATALTGETIVHDPGPDVDVALVANPPPGRLRGLPNLKLIQSLWAGIDGVLADPDLPDAPLCRMVDPAMAETMAEAALAHVLWLHRRHDDFARAQREGVWRQHAYLSPHARRVGVLGLGVMGQTVARRLEGAGFQVAAWVSRARENAVAGPDALPGFLGGCDIVINLLALTPATIGLLDARAFAAMPAGAALINLARGRHVVEDDLRAALDSGHLRHAVLDVMRDEPPPPGHWVWPHPRVTLTPHVAAPSDPASGAAVVADNILRLRQGRPLLHTVERGRGY